MQSNDQSRPEKDEDEAARAAAAETDPTQAAEDTAAAAEAAAPEEGAEDPRDVLIEGLKAELNEAKDQQLRALAEAENVRRRAQREREDAVRYGAVGLARDMLTVADNLRRALESAPPAEEVPEELKSLIEGIGMVEKELSSVFERHNIQPVPGVGEPFDHNLHQAVVELESAEIEPGNIAQVLQTGYQLHDRLLRAAMVAVAKAPGG